MAWGLLYNFKKSLYIKTTLMSVFLRARFRARVRAESAPACAPELNLIRIGHACGRGSGRVQKFKCLLFHT